MKTITKSILKEIYKPRDKWCHKGDFGRLLVIGGSRRYKGCVALCSLAALRSGVDLVWAAAPESVADIITSFSPDLITEPLEGDYLNPENLKKLLVLSKNFDAITIGSGLGRMVATQKTVLEFLKKVSIPTVIDADALHIIANNKKILKQNFILTPHAYEFYSLTGYKVKNNTEDRIKAVKTYAKDFNTTILLKGYKDVISNGKDVAINSSGAPGMSVGGTGDTLTGIVGALLARGTNCFKAACAGAYINGKAGELATKRLGESMLASDILDEIPHVLCSVKE